MKVVVDTNVILSASLGEGAPGDVIKMAFDGTIDLVFSRETFGELGDVLLSRAPFINISRQIRAAFLGHIAEHSTWSKPVPQPVKCRDQNDQVFLDLAAASGASFLVTGDQDLLAIGNLGPVRIVTPRQFLDEGRSP